MPNLVAIAIAFAAGVVSFLSPCVLPLIPAYLSFMTGLTAAELAQEDRQTARVLAPALLFVAGFSVVFVALGATASVLGDFLSEYRLVIEKVAGIAVIAFGVLMLGIIKVPWLYGEARVDMEKSRSFGKGAAFVMGMSLPRAGRRAWGRSSALSWRWLPPAAVSARVSCYSLRIRSGWVHRSSSLPCSSAASAASCAGSVATRS